MVGAPRSVHCSLGTANRGERYFPRPSDLENLTRAASSPIKPLFPAQGEETQSDDISDPLS